MLVGHFAIGLALKARFPKTPALPIMFGVAFLDLLDGIFIAAGINQVTPNLEAGPYLFFDLTFIDWDHSLLAALFWSAVWAALFLKNKHVAVVAFVACFSHFLADWPLHNSDLALYPYSQTHFGLGLWGSMGAGAWVLECLFAATLGVYAWIVSARRSVRLTWPLFILGVLAVRTAPWLTSAEITTLLEPTLHIVFGLSVFATFFVSAALMTWLTDRAEVKALKTP